MNYLHWDEKTITDFSEKNVSDMYDRGYVFTRIGKGVMQQTRSVRIDLSKFELSSENRRVLKKTEGLSYQEQTLPLSNYDIRLGKLAKNFYDSKFGPGIMSAQKIKEILTSPKESPLNFNLIIGYFLDKSDVGWTICYENKDILHYSYPFYDLEKSPTDMGMGMMLRAIEYAKKAGMKYIYLGSLQRPGDVYKLQFSGLEWFDGKTWQTDLEEAKKILREVPPAGGSKSE